MNILFLNAILFTPEKGVIPKMKSIKDTMIYNMCLGAKKLGHHVTLVASADYKPIETEEYDVEVLFFKSNFRKIFKPSSLPFSLELKHFLKRNHTKYDLVVSGGVFTFQSLMAAQICPLKTVLWQEQTEHQQKLFKLPSKVWFNVVVPVCMSNIKVVVPRSFAAYRFTKQYLKQTSSIIVDHGINVDKFIQSDKKKRQIISSSQLVYRKNVDGIIEKFYHLHNIPGYEDIRLVIAGRGEEENNLKLLVKKLQLEESVKFVGFLSQAKLNEYIRSSMAFLVNTRKDLNMVSIPESIVSGTPILTNWQPASAEYIDKERLGIAKDNWSVEELKEIIDNNVMFVNNCISYRRNLTAENSVQMLIDIFNHAK